MDDKGEVISSCDVDDSLGLQIWTKGFSPRLVIFNKNMNTRKLIRLSWLENLDRKLSLKGKKLGSSSEYTLPGLLPHLQRLLSEYAVYTSFKPRLWKFIASLEKSFHTPAPVFDKGELTLLQEDKRSSLWIADMTGDKKGEGNFRPFFPLSEKEQGVFPAEGLPIADNKRGVDELFKTGILRKLAVQSPSRWYLPIRVVAAAMLLGFSFCEQDGSDSSDDFWSGESLNVKLDDTRLCGMGRKFVGYTRHFGSLDMIEARSAYDSDKELQGEGYARKRRIEFQDGVIGNMSYSVTFFDREEDGFMAIGCKPKAFTQNRSEPIYTMPVEVYSKALSDDTQGGAADDYFTVAQLISAKTFQKWLGNVVTYTSSFTGTV